MNGVQRQPEAAAPGSIGEDLDVVLGRFQSWAATRMDTISAPTKKLIRPIAGCAKSSADAREISYDQALRASRHPRHLENTSPEPTSPAAPAAAFQGDLNRNNAEDSKLHRPPIQPPQANSAKDVGGDRRRPSAADVSSRSEQDTPSHAISEIQAPAPISTSRVRVRQSARKPAQQAKSVKKRGITKTAGVSLTAGLTSEPLPTPDLPRRRPQPAFGAVLAGTATRAASPILGLSSPAAPKSTCLTLRVSDVEQARIAACAAQAGISVSAYLRQCALGVDDLRDQVEVALSQLRKEQERTIPTPGISAIPGILRHFGMQCLRSLGLASREPTTLAISSR